MDGLIFEFWIFELYNFHLSTFTKIILHLQILFFYTFSHLKRPFYRGKQEK